MHLPWCDPTNRSDYGEAVHHIGMQTTIPLPDLVDPAGDPDRAHEADVEVYVSRYDLADMLPSGPFIELAATSSSGCGGAPLTRSEARQVAAALLNAADALEDRGQAGAGD